MRPLVTGIGVLVGLGSLTIQAVEPSRQPRPTLPQVLAKAAEYHASYATQVSGVSLEEQYQLMDVTGGRTQSTTRIASDVVFVNVQGQLSSLRDPYSVDTRSLRERTPRIMQLLAAPATPTARDWKLASSYPQQGSIHFVLDLIVKVNDPLVALQFMSASAQPNFKYRLDGNRTINGTAVVGLRFEEPSRRDHTYVLATRGNARATGRLWIDPLTGAVHHSELWVDSQTETAIVQVKYEAHPTLGHLLPVQMTETYEHREGGGAPQAIGSGIIPSGSVASRMSMQCRATYTQATFSPIDLSRIR